MSKTKIVIAIFSIGFSFILVEPIFQRIRFIDLNAPSDKIKIEFTGNSAQVNKTFEFQHEGCKEVGLYSKINTFADFLMQSLYFQGKYTLTYLSNDTIVRSKNATISKDAKITTYAGIGGETRYNALILDIAEIKYKKLNINFELKDLEQGILSDDIYFYVKMANLPCNYKQELSEEKI
ncbi:MAG: hypothetical protein LBS39_02995 [Campylobacteraceae bacterium]|nr:hypothetical protein [Campylobacteraceae bacterium]